MSYAHSIAQPTFGSSLTWNYVKHKLRRPLSSIILPNGVVEALIRDAQEFLDKGDRYVSAGIPHHRGYNISSTALLGQGKVPSTIYALAGALNFEIYSLSLASSFVDDSFLQHAASSIPKKALFLIEDIDCAFASRDDADEMDEHLPLGPTPPGEPVVSGQKRSAVTSQATPQDLWFFGLHPTILPVSNVYKGAPDIYLTEWQFWLAVHHDIAISISALQKTLQQAGLTRKLLSKIAIERDKERCRAWAASIHDDFEDKASYFVTVDETSKNEDTLARDYGRSMVGERAIIESEFVRGPRHSIGAAMMTEGYIAVKVFEGPFLSMNDGKLIALHATVAPNDPYAPDSERSVLILIVESITWLSSALSTSLLPAIESH
ncbi:hypothetical protein B0H13DRAFT_2303737 [Mycena leptocephala]|nr:hypothetical protein B0H13DRAFT_2303737 [Mycena leptocephala]